MIGLKVRIEAANSEVTGVANLEVTGVANLGVAAPLPSYPQLQP